MKKILVISVLSSFIFISESYSAKCPHLSASDLREIVNKKIFTDSNGNKWSLDENNLIVERKSFRPMYGASYSTAGGGHAIQSETGASGTCEYKDVGHLAPNPTDEHKVINKLNLDLR